jgi:uncharacterized coiled-coil protein SlyX
MTVKTTTRSNLTPKDKAQQYLNTRAATELPKALQRIRHLEEQLADAGQQIKELAGAGDKIASMQLMVDMAEKHADRQKKVAEDLNDRLQASLENNRTLGADLRAARKELDTIRTLNLELITERDKLCAWGKKAEARIAELEAPPTPAPQPQDTQPEALQAAKASSPCEAELIDPAKANELAAGAEAIGMKMHTDTSWETTAAILGRVGHTRVVVHARLRDDLGKAGNISTKPRRCIDITVFEAPKVIPV